MAIGPVDYRYNINLQDNNIELTDSLNILGHGVTLDERITFKLYIQEQLKDVRVNCFCASLLRTAARANSHATSCIERARQVLKWTMIGQMVIAIALLGFNDLGRSVTPTFLFRNRFYLQLSPHCSKMNKKSVWQVKKISRFLSTGHGILPSWLWSVNANLFFEEPHQLTNFA